MPWGETRLGISSRIPSGIQWGLHCNGVADQLLLSTLTSLSAVALEGSFHKLPVHDPPPRKPNLRQIDTVDIWETLKKICVKKLGTNNVHVYDK